MKKKKVKINDEYGLALVADGNPNHSYMNPYHGAMGAVAEVVRNLVSVCAEPLALVDNLNFASPERPKVYWSFAETVRGLADAARAFGLAYVSGNVSFYNEFAGRPIKPTPVVAVLGKVKLEEIPYGTFEEGLLIGVVGLTKPELGGSELFARLGANGGLAPRVNLEEEKANAEGVLRAIRRGLVRAVHDVGRGGLAVALAEMALNGVGFTADLSKGASSGTSQSSERPAGATRSSSGMGRNSSKNQFRSLRQSTSPFQSSWVRRNGDSNVCLPLGPSDFEGGEAGGL